MTFVAKYKGKRVDATQILPDDWLKLKTSDEKNNFVCNDPDCNSKMILKTYQSTGTQFFAHKSVSPECVYHNNPKSELHLVLQRQVVNIVKEMKWIAVMECIFPKSSHGNKVVVDVLASREGYRSIAFEIQLSPQSDAVYKSRTERYSREDLDTHWITDSFHTTISGISKIRLNQQEGTFNEDSLRSVLNNPKTFKTCPYNPLKHWCVGKTCDCYKDYDDFIRSKLVAAKIDLNDENPSTLITQLAIMRVLHKFDRLDEILALPDISKQLSKLHSVGNFMSDNFGKSSTIYNWSMSYLSPKLDIIYHPPCFNIYQNQCDAFCDLSQIRVGTISIGTKQKKISHIFFCRKCLSTSGGSRQVAKSRIPQDELKKAVQILDYPKDSGVLRVRNLILPNGERLRCLYNPERKKIEIKRL